MLYSLILGFVIVIEPFFLYKAFKVGYNLRSKEENKPIIPEKPRKTHRERRKELKYEQLLSNIDNYDGTPNGQKEIK